MLRVFLELSIDHHLTSIGIKLTEKVSGGREYDKKLSKKLEEAIENLILSGGVNKKDFNFLTRGISKSGPLNIDLLHDYVHNRFTTPSRADLIAAWDGAQPLFEKVWA